MLFTDNLGLKIWNINLKDGQCENQKFKQKA